MGLETGIYPAGTEADALRTELCEPYHTIMSHFYRPQRRCGKVIFSHLSVNHSVHGGVSASVHARIQIPWTGTTPQAGTPPTTVTAADGTHPTGMLSCYTKK